MNLPSWLPDWTIHMVEICSGMIGGTAGKTLLDRFMGRRRVVLENDKLAAETERERVESKHITLDEVDGRLRLFLDSLQSQIKYSEQIIQRLTAQVAEQDARIQQQDNEMATMRVEMAKQANEINRLNLALQRSQTFGL